MNRKQLVVLALICLSITACSATADPAGQISVEPTTKPATKVATVEPLVTPPFLPVIGPAPEFQNDIWINAETPLRLADLEGKVVLLEFWTFGWINCKRVIPWVREWYEKYESENFAVVSIHYPEFGYEEVYDNVLQATVDLNVEYPVALDNDGTTWQAYQQRYWPTRYLIDKEGNIRYKHIGEGAYEETESYIQYLTAETSQ